MRVLPATVFGETTSAAERRLHALFQEVDLPGWTAVHSLNLARVQYQRWGETDFVIIGPEGLLVIEVKGGRVARAGAGWEYTDRNGERHPDRRGPFKQAERALVSLREWLEDRLPQQDHEALPSGYAVAFPDIDFWEQSPEWAPEMVGDRRTLGDAAAAARWLKRVTGYWQERMQRTGPLESRLVKEIVRLIRPEFELVPSLATRGRLAVKASDRLTEEQMGIIDAVEMNPRLVIEGGAGTGKTFVAAELARRKAAGGDLRVGLLLPRPNSALPYKGCLPASVSVDPAGAQAVMPPVDFLLIDEAQDLMSAGGIEAIDRCVVGGLGGGSWALFLDPNQQARLRGLFEPSALDIVLDTGPARVRLPRNLRNTDEIVAAVQQATLADIGVPGGGHGPDVEVTIIDDDQGFAEACRDRLRRLAREQVRSDEVAVITWLEPDIVAQAIDGDPYPAAVLQEDARSYVGRESVSVSSPYAFQGLEAVHAIVGPLPDPTTGKGIAELYVALTRARAAIYVVADEGVAARLSGRARADGGGR